MKDLLNNIWENKFLFLGTFFVVFSVFYIFLTAIDFLPENPDVENTEETPTSIDGVDHNENEAEVADPTLAGDNNQLPEQTDSNDETEESVERILPVEISIPKLNKIIPVLNPTSRNIADLDNALLEGVVRHPDSATLGQEGNVFVLGHSSYLPQVFNENFKAFNGIQELVWGDNIEVVSNGAVYKYRVEKVYRAKASTLTVPIADTGKMLTLATCNSFGSVDDRYIVEAKQVSVRAL